MVSKLIFFWFRENEFRILNESVAEKFHILLRKHLLWFIGLLSLFENHFYRRIGAHFLIWYVRNRDHPLKTSANFHEFWPLPPNVGSFLLLLSVCKFGQFLIPSPPRNVKVLSFKNGWSSNTTWNTSISKCSRKPQNLRIRPFVSCALFCQLKAFLWLWVRWK